MRYNQAMMDALSVLGKYPGCRVGQGYHNYLFYTGRLGPASVMANHYSQVHREGDRISSAVGTDEGLDEFLET